MGILGDFFCVLGVVTWWFGEVICWVSGERMRDGVVGEIGVVDRTDTNTRINTKKTTNTGTKHQLHIYYIHIHIHLPPPGSGRRWARASPRN